MAGREVIVLPSDFRAEVKALKARFQQILNDGAWVACQDPHSSFPPQEEVFLVVFDQRDTLTHRCRILERKPGQVRVNRPSLTTKEKSQLTPDTGRFDYRVEVYYPAEVRPAGKENEEPRFCHLCDLSRGGMSLEVPREDAYCSGERIEVRLVSWDYPVRLDAEVVRAWPHEGEQRVALSFPDEMSDLQSELISTFILDVQRRQALRETPTAPAQ